MTSWTKPTDDTVEKALALARKPTDRLYFFSRLNNPQWIGPLAERGYFQFPPRAVHMPDRCVQYPFWPELKYLKNVAHEAPDQVVELVLSLPKVDNPGVYDGILEITLELPTGHSAKLQPKVLEYAEIVSPSLPHRFTDLLSHWTSQGETAVALELAEIIINFVPDPEAEAKQDRRRKDPNDSIAFLDPSPRFEEWDYLNLMENGIPPLAEQEPSRVARILIDAVAKMISLGMHQDELSRGDTKDYSQWWYPKLTGPTSSVLRPSDALVFTMTSACARVFEQDPSSISTLDQHLRDQRWDIFTRLRQHLYTLQPTDQTKPWIRGFILEHRDYAQWDRHYEFQQMIRAACLYFGEELLTMEERTLIFDTILSGPPEARYRERWGEDFTDELFAQCQRHFHRMQLAPFSTALFDPFLEYFQELEDEANEVISPDDYAAVRHTEMSPVSRRSPRSVEDLDDEALLAYINEWQDEHYDPHDRVVEVTIEALAEAFEVVFTGFIIPNDDRLRFWVANRERIERPIYVRAIVNGMQKEIKDHKLDNLDQWLSFCEWVLSHPDQERESGNWLGDQSRESPQWASSRAAVGELIRECFGEDVELPLATQGQLAHLLDLLCTQFDWGLDGNNLIFPDRNDHMGEAIKNTRSRALEDLFKFGFWVSKNHLETDRSSVTGTLEERFSSESECPLTLPERAILAVNYHHMIALEEDWAIEHKSDFFPQGSLSDWAAAFKSYLYFNRPNERAFEILRHDFDFALQRLPDLVVQDIPHQTMPEALGRHLFMYYLWGVYPLKGDDGLVERYYQSTNAAREHWAELFNLVGYLSYHADKDLDTELKGRLMAFFEWRLEAGEPTELARFNLWLKAACLEAEWRLNAYSRILDVCRNEDAPRLVDWEAIDGMIPDHTDKVVECFVKLTEKLQDNAVYIWTEPAKHILRAGLRSREKGVRENAEHAREILLRNGRFDFLDLDE